MINISNSATSLLRLELGAGHKVSGAADFHVSDRITLGVKLRVSGQWLEKQKARLSPNQQQWLGVAMNALGGNEAFSNLTLNHLGGQFNLERDPHGAHTISFEREQSTPDFLAFLGISDRHGKSLLELGTRLATAMSANEPNQVPYQANETSILAHSRHALDAAWQRSLYIVPFLTSQGQKVKVVGDYVKGNAQQFEVKNNLGQTYALLKRTLLDKGETAWTLLHASQQPILSGLKPSLAEVGNYLRQASSGLDSLKHTLDSFASRQTKSRPVPEEPAVRTTDEQSENAVPPLPPRPTNGKPPTAEGVADAQLLNKPTKLYEILGVATDASLNDIKKAYRLGALQNHPDKNLGNDEATEAFQKISAAYQILFDVAKRADYDAGRSDENGHPITKQDPNS